MKSGTRRRRVALSVATLGAALTACASGDPKGNLPWQRSNALADAITIAYVEHLTGRPYFTHIAGVRGERSRYPLCDDSRLTQFLADAQNVCTVAVTAPEESCARGCIAVRVSPDLMRREDFQRVLGEVLEDPCRSFVGVQKFKQSSPEWRIIPVGLNGPRAVGYHSLGCITGRQELSNRLKSYDEKSGVLIVN